MATINSTYPYNPQRRKKQRYVLVERVIDFTNNKPINTNYFRPGGALPSDVNAWAAGDILQAVNILAGQTVISVQCDVMTHSADGGDFIRIGDGNNNSRWGTIELYTDPRISAASREALAINKEVEWQPRYYSVADTVDITIGKAALDGKIRLIVHILEDDR